MSRVTRFAGRDRGPAVRVAGFLAHLRENGLRLGVGETRAALGALRLVNAADPAMARAALRAVCTGCREEAARFDALFDAYWMDMGRVRRRAAPGKPPHRCEGSAPSAPSARDAAGERHGETGRATAPDTDEGAADGTGDGRLLATRTDNLARRDLRDLVRPDEIAAAQEVARRLGAALRDRRSRRRIADRKGAGMHFRRTIRRSLATGGDPIHPIRATRPDRACRIVALCDVSGSMGVYARVFLAFLAGLMRGDPAAEAYLFHTRLVRVTDALRDRDALRAIGRLSLMAEGFGGGSKIGPCLGRFADTHARRCVDGRSAVVILSDGCDTAAPEILAAALAGLRRRGGRILWLNPLKGWKGYAPVAAGMAAALPYLDLFAAANTLDDLAALERELARL